MGRPLQQFNLSSRKYYKLAEALTRPINETDSGGPVPYSKVFSYYLKPYYAPSSFYGKSMRLPSVITAALVQRDLSEKAGGVMSVYSSAI